MFPHFAEEEKKAREEFYRKRGEIEGQSKLQQLAQKRKRDGDLDEDDPASIAASLSTSTLDSHHKAPTLSKLIHGYYDDAVTFRLTAVSLGKDEPSDAQQEGSMEVEKEKEKENGEEEKEEGEEKLPQIRQFYVRTTGRVTVRQLQKLIFAELIEQQMEEMEAENENPNKAVEESNNNNNTGNKDDEENKDNGNEKKEGEKSKKEYVVRTPEEIVIRLNGKGKPLCQDNTLNFLYDSYKIDPHTQVPTFTYTRIDKKKLKK